MVKVRVHASYRFALILTLLAQIRNFQLSRPSTSSTPLSSNQPLNAGTSAGQKWITRPLLSIHVNSSFDKTFPACATIVQPRRVRGPKSINSVVRAAVEHRPGFFAYEYIPIDPSKAQNHRFTRYLASVGIEYAHDFGARQGIAWGTVMVGRQIRLSSKASLILGPHLTYGLTKLNAAQGRFEVQPYHVGIAVTLDIHAGK